MTTLLFFLLLFVGVAPVAIVIWICRAKIDFPLVGFNRPTSSKDYARLGQSAVISGHTSGAARTPASLLESSVPVLAEPSRTSGSHGEARGSKHKDRTIKGRTLAALLSISPTLTKPN